MTKLKTEELEAKNAAVARAISSTGHDGFTTQKFSYFKDDEAPGLTCWLEAWKNPQDERWVVEKHEDAAGVRKKKTVLDNACFFDALHYCAGFEEHEKGQGAKIEAHEDTHYRTAGEASGVPFDMDGFPHPAAYGRILTDGRFDENAYKVAGTTKGKSIDPVSLQDAIKKSSDKLLPVPLKKTGDSKALLAHIDQNIRNRRPYEKAIDSVQETERALQVSMNAGFKLENGYKKSFFMDVEDAYSGFELPVCVAYVFTAGIGYLVDSSIRRGVDYAKGDPYVSLKRHFDVTVGKVNASARALPNGAEKTLIKDFALAARSTYYLEHAASLYRDYSRSDKNSTASLRKGIKMIDKAVAINDTREFVEKDENLAENLKAAYLQGEFPNCGTFSKDLCEQGKQLRDHLQSVIKASYNL